MRSTVSPRILVASGIGLVMVLGAYFITSQPTDTRLDSRKTAVVGPAPERSFITVADEDGDGEADWKQTLPDKPEWLTRADVATSTSSATSTHTEALAKDMLRGLMSGSMLGGFGDNSEEVAARSAEYIHTLATDPLYQERDINLSLDTSDEALRAYGNRIAAITFENGVAKQIEDELTILDTAVREQRPEVLDDLALIVASYEGMIEDMLAMAVPRTYITEHLDLINTYNAIRIDVEGMQQIFSDPLYALIRIQRYEDDIRGLYQAISNVYLKLDAAGIEWTDDDTASQLIRIEN